MDIEVQGRLAGPQAVNQVYIDTARLLTQIAPLIFADNVFALKGGTAINLFVRDMPRLSVDLDLVFVDHRTARGAAVARINEREFLLSLAHNAPNWELLGIEHLDQLPGIRWRLENLERLSKANPKKLKVQAQELERLLRKSA